VSIRQPSYPLFSKQGGLPSAGRPSVADRSKQAPADEVWRSSRNDWVRYMSNRASASTGTEEAVILKSQLPASSNWRCSNPATSSGQVVVHRLRAKGRLYSRL
jgi:hypothetical protein